MIGKPQSPRERADLAAGIIGMPCGSAMITATRTLVVADLHLGYESAIGGALPLWSTAEKIPSLLELIAREEAHELVLLGDVVHSSNLGDRACEIVREALERLRAATTLTVIAGNHEGRSRAVNMLGESCDIVERGGWTLSHGDDIEHRGERSMIGHFHPAIGFGGGRSAPAFLAAPNCIVLPAATPYSVGLDLLSREATGAFAPWLGRRHRAEVIVTTGDKLYPLGLWRSLCDVPNLRPRNSRFQRPKPIGR